MLKQLNEKKDKMSQLVEAAHGTRGTSNEKTTSTKKKSNYHHQEMVQNMAAINDFATHLQQFDNFEAQTSLFSQKSHNYNEAQAMSLTQSKIESQLAQRYADSHLPRADQPKTERHNYMKTQSGVRIKPRQGD